MFYLILIASVFGKKSCPNDGTECELIKTKLGKIGGIQLRTVFGEKPFCAYRGIRFGLPPIGNLRFKVSS